MQQENVYTLPFQFKLVAKRASALNAVIFQLERSVHRFTSFYSGQHSGRKLNWLYNMSKGELVANCFKNRYRPTKTIIFLFSKYNFCLGTPCRRAHSRWPSCCSTTSPSRGPSPSSPNTLRSSLTTWSRCCRYCSSPSCSPARTTRTTSRPVL